MNAANAVTATVTLIKSVLLSENPKLNNVIAARVRATAQDSAANLHPAPSSDLEAALFAAIHDVKTAASETMRYTPITSLLSAPIISAPNASRQKNAVAPTNPMSLSLLYRSYADASAAATIADSESASATAPTPHA